MALNIPSNKSLLSASRLKSIGLTLHDQATRISLLLLVAFLLSVFTHTTEHLAQTLVTSADTSSEQTTVVERQDCQLCQHSIDTPPNPPQLIQLARQGFYQQNLPQVDVVVLIVAYAQPQLRAPPTTSSLYIMV